MTKNIKQAVSQNIYKAGSMYVVKIHRCGKIHVLGSFGSREVAEAIRDEFKSRFPSGKTGRKILTDGEKAARTRRYMDELSARYSARDEDAK